MDTSIRLYNSNSRLHSVLDDHTGSPTVPLVDEKDNCVEAASVDEGERSTDTISLQSVDASQEV
jgi:hypothetical protein